MRKAGQFTNKYMDDKVITSYGNSQQLNFTLKCNNHNISAKNR